MARIFPFRALRYNPSLVRVEDCVTQPYDKITPSMQAGYYARSPYNLVRIILGLPELFDRPGTDDVYTRAGRDFHAWRREGVLAQAAEPCLFAYAQRFTPPGSTEAVARRGLIAPHGPRLDAALDVWSGRGDSNARPQPWQGCALPLSYARSRRGGRARKGRPAGWAA